MAETDWLTARDRAVLYVRALRAARRGGAGMRGSRPWPRRRPAFARSPARSPTAETMRLLRERLEERRPPAEEARKGTASPP